MGGPSWAQNFKKMASAHIVEQARLMNEMK